MPVNAYNRKSFNVLLLEVSGATLLLPENQQGFPLCLPFSLSDRICLGVGVLLVLVEEKLTILCSQVKRNQRRDPSYYGPRPK